MTRDGPVSYTHLDVYKRQDWILKERGWEFWYEGKRREDLIRMGKYVETGKKYSTNFSEKNLLFPIPTSVIIENSHIEQNPHY